MLRRFTTDQVVEKLGIDDAELRFLVHHFREFLPGSEADNPNASFAEQEVALLARAFRLVREEGRDPAEIRASLQDELSGSRMAGNRQPVLLAFCSGRTGTGKSILIYNIAAALAVRGSRCAIFDCTLVHDDGILRFAPSPPGESWNQTLNSGLRLISGKRLLRGATAPSNPAHADLETQLEAISNASDFILVDVGAGRSDNALRFAMAVDETVIVTTPDVGSNTDSFSVIRMLRDVDQGLRISIIVNRASGLADARESFARINGAASRLAMGEINGLGWVAEDEALRSCAASHEAVVDALPTSASARCIGRIADHLIHRLIPVKRTNTGGLVNLVRILQHAVEREAPVTEQI